jgi:hypothetical protein
MPSIKDAIERNSRRIAAGGETQTGQGNELSDLAAVSSPPQDLPLGGGLPQRGMFPASLVLASDRSDSSREFRGAGARSATFPYQTSPQTVQNTTVIQQATASATASAATAALLLQTDGINNPNQKILNLLSGTGITLASDPTGGVTIAATSAGDGLIHGETPWETDPSAVILVDDFEAGDIASALFGSLRWAQNGQMLSPHLLTGSALTANIGAVSWDNSTSQSVAGQLLPGFAVSDAFTAAWSGLFEAANWKMIWVWQFQRAPALSSSATFAMTQKSVYIGMGFNNGSISTRPSVFAGLRYDTDTTAPAISDTTFQFEVVVNAVAGTRNNTQGTVFDTGMTPAEGKWYRLEISSVTVGTVDMSLTDGSTTFTKTGITVPQATTGAAASVTVQGQTGQLLFGTGGVVLPFSPGTNMIVSGIIGAGSAFNGTWPVTNISASSISALGGITLGNTGVTGQFSALPSMYPMVVFGNDTQATPATNAKILVDFFGFAWNPGTTGGTGTPNANLARFW